MATITTLTEIPAAGAGFTHEIVLTAADMAAMPTAAAVSIYPAFNAATTKTLLLVKDAALFVKTAFNAFQSDGTTAVTLTLSVGDGTTAALFVAALDLKTIGWGVCAATTSKVLAGDIIKVTPTWGASRDYTKTTVGEARIYLQIVDGPVLTK